MSSDYMFSDYLEGVEELAESEGDVESVVCCDVCAAVVTLDRSRAFEAASFGITEVNHIVACVDCVDKRVALNRAIRVKAKIEHERQPRLPRFARD